MKKLEQKLNELLCSQQDLEKLLCLEKEMRGVDKEKLVFLGMANIAEYYWCAMKSFYKSKEGELGFFGAYLEDRIHYSYKLGLIEHIPKDKKKLLQIGNEISMSYIEKLLKEKSKSYIDGIRMAVTITDNNGIKVMVINPALSVEDREHWEGRAKIEGIRVADLEEFPKIRGNFLQDSKAEDYPSIRWNFDWNDYVIVGVPDGITDSFVYEFKTTRNRFLMSFVKPVARTQADLYGFFFGRQKKRFQIYIVDEDVIETFDSEIDKNGAEGVLNKFKNVYEGFTPIPPKPWKCKKCEYKDACKLYVTG